MIGAILAKWNVRASFNHYNRRDLSAFLAGWADDASFMYPGDLPVSGKIEGKKNVETWFRNFMDRFPRIVCTPKNVSVQNIFDCLGTNVIAVEWDIALTNRRGEEFQYNGMTLIHIKWGKAVLARDYIYDTEVWQKAWSAESGR